MPTADPDLDFSVIDRARNLAGLLRLLFAMLGATTPKAVADLLNNFDHSADIDPETVGRWLRGERRPSKKHLQLIIRLLQAHGLMGKLPATDRLFTRIAAFYAKLDHPDARPSLTIGIRRMIRAIRRPSLHQGSADRMRKSEELALALHLDLATPGPDLPRFNAQCAKQKRRTINSWRNRS